MGDLEKLFIDNFQGSIHHPATRHDLRLCKQERGEALRSYIKRFFDTRATIANIVDDDVIDCFHNGLATQQLYCDFGRNRPRLVVALRDMMLGWPTKKNRSAIAFPVAMTTIRTVTETRDPIKISATSTRSGIRRT